MSSAPFVWQGQVVAIPLRRRAVTVSVFVLLVVVVVAPFATGLLIVMVTRSALDPVAVALGQASVFATPVCLLAASIGAAAWLWSARINTG